ncbi:alpha/beta hydrolase family protein [Marinilabilia rubra]|uniref:Alpha/beta hydrolase n=1 Tax=Marinilabilia rubra TaxID=2162893 RepID=A0A2U2B950_9BACT|nr:hypothetical protein [Marinilabilia rubra]PWD99573.1 hypothetical protein DDZ16_08955 [Marinilabilia rubra]
MKKTVALFSAAVLLGLGLAQSGCSSNNNESKVTKISVITPKDSLKVPNGIIELPLAAKSGTAYFYEPARKTEKTPIIMVPGMGLSAYIFTDTPDERKAWADIFSENGHPVYVYEDPSIMVHEGVDYEKTGMKGRKWNTTRTWSTWGMGPEYPKPYEEVKYPVQQFDSLVASFPDYGNFGFIEVKKDSMATSGASKLAKNAKQSEGHTDNQQAEARGGRRRGGGGGGFGAQIQVENLLTLMDQVGDCILMVHSASGSTGFEAIRQNGDNAEALIVLEPVGSPVKEGDVKKHFADIPFLGVYGDNIDNRRQGRRKQAVEETIRLIKENGGSAEMIDLPAMSIYGNTHLMMQDTNNAEIAGMIMQWIENQQK